MYEANYGGDDSYLDCSDNQSGIFKYSPGSDDDESNNVVRFDFDWMNIKVKGV